MKAKRLVSIFLILCMLPGLFSACSHETADPAADATEEPQVVDVNEIKSVTINEVMVRNTTLVLGCMDAWAELYNSGDTDIALTSCSIMKEGGDRQLALDELVIPAKEFLIVMLPESVSFGSADGAGKLLFSCGSCVIDGLDIPDPSLHCSWSHEGECQHPTPGFPNTEEGFAGYLETVELPDLRISEIVSSNKTHADEDGNCYDFVELYNASDEAVELSDYWLSDSKSKPRRFQLPEQILEPGGYFVVYCSGLELPGHAPFKISSSGETVYLSDKSGFTDAVRVPSDLRKDESYGRNGQLLVYMQEATPGAENAEGFLNMVAKPKPNLDPGFYDHPISVELSGEGEIRYTTDGTAPTAQSTLYTEPIAVESITSIRAVCVSEGRMSLTSELTYLVDIDHAYPVVNIAIRPDYLNGAEGVLNNIETEYEHESFVTMTGPEGEYFAAPCGFKLHGNDSKKGEKQNFQLRFRSVYGMSKLKYKVFENRDAEVYNSLILKGGSEDYLFCCMRDELCTGLVDGVTELSVQAYRPVVLYLNGSYWGFYWLRERYDTTYCAERLGVDKDSVNIVKTYGRVTAVGSGDGFTELIEYCKKHDLRDTECYNYVLARVDCFSLMDWYICRSYFADQDLANVRMYNSPDADGKWRWCFYDLDWSFFVSADDPIGRTMPNDGNHEIIRALLKNPEFKDMFLRRYAYLMQAVLNERVILARIDELAAIMEPEMPRDRERYGLSMDAWRMNLENLRAFVRNGKRDAEVLRGIQTYFGLSDAQMHEYFGR